MGLPRQESRHHLSCSLSSAWGKARVGLSRLSVPGHCQLAAPAWQNLLTSKVPAHPPGSLPSALPAPELPPSSRGPPVPFPYALLGLPASLDSPVAGSVSFPSARLGTS